MNIDLQSIAQQIIQTGDHAPIKICLTIVAVAAIALAVTSIISKKKNK
jgi:hypothetical protein